MGDAASHQGEVDFGREGVLGVCWHGSSYPPSKSRIAWLDERHTHLLATVEQWHESSDVATADVLVRAHLVRHKRSPKPVRFRYVTVDKETISMPPRHRP